MRTSLILTTALGLIASSALAQSSGSTPFNGPFAGIQGGWQLDRLNLDTDYGAGPLRERTSNDGFLYGGQVGYDARIAPRIVAGVEGSVTGDTGSTTGLDAGGNTYSASLGRTFDVSGRVGYLLNPTGLVYGRAGWTNAEFNLSDPVQTVSNDRDGYLLGLGYEHALSRHLSARLEYDYSHFGDGDLPAYVADTGAAAAYASDNRHAVTLGVNFRF